MRCKQSRGGFRARILCAPQARTCNVRATNDPQFVGLCEERGPSCFDQRPACNHKRFARKKKDRETSFVGSEASVVDVLAWDRL